jgi:hypothetical protein
MTRRVIDGSLWWHARAATPVCEAHQTTSPTYVAFEVREDSGGICQQDGGGGARLVPHG